MAKRLNKNDERYQGLDPCPNQQLHNYNYEHHAEKTTSNQSNVEGPVVESLIKTYIHGGANAYNSEIKRLHSSKKENKNREEHGHGKKKNIIQ